MARHIHVHLHTRTRDTQRRGAGIAYRTPDGRYLLLKRGQDGDHKGEWCFPGGSIEPGESPEQAARREAHEETGVKVDGPCTLLSEIDSPALRFTTYLQETREFTPKLNHEHTDYVWAAPDALPEPMMPAVRKIIHKD